MTSITQGTSEFGNLAAPLALTTARAYASDKSLATYGTPMLSYEYGRDYPEVTRVRDEPAAECNVCSWRSGLLVIDVDDAEAFAVTATALVLAGARTVRRGDHYHAYVDARALAASGRWVKGAKIPGADVKGAGRGGFVMAAGATHRSGMPYELVGQPVAWSGELEQALVADGCRVAGIAELSQANGASRADVDDITSTWGFEPATDEDYERISAGVGAKGHTNSALVAVCHRLLDYAAERPESALGVLWRLEADYETHPDPRYAGQGETAVRKALETAYASHVPAGEYLAGLDRETLERFFGTEGVDKIYAKAAAVNGPGLEAGAMPRMATLSLAGCGTEQAIARKVVREAWRWARFTDAGTWIVARGGAWEEAEPAAIVAVAADAAAALYDPDAEKGTPQATHNAATGRLSSEAGASAVARKMRAVAYADGSYLRVADLDRDGTVLWAEGRCFDIASGREVTERAGEPHLKSAAHAPAPGDHPAFDAMRAALFPDPGLAAWATLVAARFYLGVPAKPVVELKGPPFTGKSPWAMLHARLLGSYAQVVNEDILTKEDAALAFGDVPGARLAYLDEWTDLGGRRPANRIKALSNGQRFTARSLYGRPAVHEARHTFAVSLNDEALLPYGDSGVHERLVRVPFGNLDREAVRGAVARAYAAIDDEGPAVMATMLAHAAVLLADPLRGTMADAPACARESLAESVADADPVGLFISECDDLRGTDPRWWPGGAELWRAYRAFRDSAGMRGGTATMTGFGRELERRGYQAADGGPRSKLRVRPLRWRS